jgi:GTP cyclohydrolase I
VATDTKAPCIHGLPATDHGCQPKAGPTPSAVDQRLVGARRAVDDLLAALAVPRDDHTEDTPNRVAKSLLELLSGYDEDPALHLDTTFPGPEDAGVVVLSGVRFTSLCAHHLLPFTGTGTVAYLPKPRQPLAGPPELAQVLDGYSRRLQTQEWLGRDVADPQ